MLCHLASFRYLQNVLNWNHGCNIRGRKAIYLSIVCSKCNRSNDLCKLALNCVPLAIAPSYLCLFETDRSCPADKLQTEIVSIQASQVSESNEGKTCGTLDMRGSRPQNDNSRDIELYIYTGGFVYTHKHSSATIDGYQSSHSTAYPSLCPCPCQPSTPWPSDVTGPGTVPSPVPASFPLR